MINKSPPAKKTVELADAPEPGSRIRRDPLNDRASLVGRIPWRSREWEVRVATAGILFFAIAITAVVIDVGELISR